jgi:hypothetical protein
MTDESDSLIDEWIDLPRGSRQRRSIEATVRQDPYGGALVDLPDVLGRAAGTTDIAGQVRRSLPPGSPVVYRRLAEVVVRAWEDPDLRASIRGAPRATLAREGVRLPDDVYVAIVDPRRAHLPTATLVEVPLPAEDDRAMAGETARQELAATEFGVLLHEVAPVRASRAALLRLPAWWPERRTDGAHAAVRPSRRFAARELALVVGAVVVGVVALLALPVGRGSLAGTALGTDVPGLALLAAAGLAAVVFALLRRR